MLVMILSTVVVVPQNVQAADESNQVSVTYNIDNPAQAYLTHNIGWINA